MALFYFTFLKESSLYKCYVKIEAPSAIEARKQMFEHYMMFWGYHYTPEGFDGQAESYGLTEVPLGTPQQFAEDFLCLGN